MSRLMDFSPEKEYRPASFWALNGELCEDELTRQIEAFSQAGWGGFFMHARSALKTPYLSQQFMEKIKHCVAKAREFELDAWIYDELDWPSGTAGGALYRHGAKSYACHVKKIAAQSENRAANELFRQGEKVFVKEYGSGANELCADITRDFLELTHEYYKEAIGDEFGKTVPGTFFDEPQYASYYEPNDYIPWSDDLPGKYTELWGENVCETLPSLFENTGDYKEARKRFWYTVTELYAHSFAKPIYDWCEQNGLKSTGHFEWEETFYSQLRCTGDLMRHFEFMHYPGNDSLGRGMFAPWIFLETSSVAAQLGKERVMTECFGVGGQNMTLNDRKWIYGMLQALGVDFFVPHITHYSLRGANKRDCPPNNNYIQPWWKHAKIMEDGVARAAKILAGSKKSPGVLVLYPVVTAWCEYFPGNKEPLDKLQSLHESLFYSLFDAGIPFHYGDEMIMERHAKVQNGVLCVGKTEYRTVVIANAAQLLPKTAELFRACAAGGVRLLSLGDCPEELSGLTERVKDEKALLDILKASQAGPFESAGRHWVSPFENVRGRGWFVSNPERLESAELEYTGKNPAALLDTQGFSESALFPGDKFTLPAGGFAVVEELCEQAFTTPAQKLTPVKTLAPTGDWSVSSRLEGAREKNAAVLDFCELRFSEGEWSLPMYTRDAYALIADRAKKIAAAGPRQNTLGKNTRFELRFSFINNSTAKCFILCAEEADTLGITVNRRTVTKISGYYLDRDILRLDISDYVVPGENEVIIAGQSAPDFVVEDLYLLGDFAVAIEGANTRVLYCLPETVSPFGLEHQGFAHFSGELTLGNSVFVEGGFERAVLRVVNPKAAAIPVCVNGEETGVIVSAPYELDITDNLFPGENKIEITLATTLQNLLGPLHNSRIDPYSVGVGDYNDKENWTDTPNLVPVGFERVEIELYKA